MIPVKLSLSGFLSYREPVDLDFTTFDLACISGSNGAGKSTLLDAITWVLFGKARKDNDSLINTQCNIAEVQFIFDYEGNRYKVNRAIQRAKTGRLEFFLLDPATSDWKVLTGHTKAATQKTIEETLRLNYETFVNASFFLQGKADQFTQQGATDRKKILSQILGLEVWEEYRQQAATLRRTVEMDINVLDARLAEIQSELNEEAARKESLKKLRSDLASLEKLRQAKENELAAARNTNAVLDLQRSHVQSLHRRRAELADAFSSLEKRLTDRQSERDDYRSRIAHAGDIESAHQNFLALQAELDELDRQSTSFREFEKRREVPRLAIQQIQAQLSNDLLRLEDQYQSVQIAEKELHDLEVILSGTREEISALESELNRRSELEERQQEWNAQSERARLDNDRLKKEGLEIVARKEQLADVEGALCPLCGQPLQETERLALIASLEEQAAHMRQQYEDNTNITKQAASEIAALSRESAGLKQKDIELRRSLEKMGKHVERQTAFQTTLNTWQATGAAGLDKLKNTLDTDDYALDERKHLAAIDTDLKALGYDSAHHDAVRDRVLRSRSVLDERNALETARGALAPVEREIKGIQQELESRRAELSRCQAEVDEAAAALAAAEAVAPNLTLLTRQLQDAQQEVNRLMNSIGAAEQKVLVLDDLRQRKAALDQKKDEYNQAFARYKNLEKAFGKDGVPALLIEQALPQIEARANEILDRLSNGSMSVRFQTQAEYRDRRREDRRETLDIHISDGAGPREYELYSGGEAFRVNFAIRLALSEVLAQRAGARLQTLVVDEGFGSQDAQGRQRLVEAINLIRNDFAKILVITHIDELKDVFPARIEVSKTSVGSQVHIL